MSGMNASAFRGIYFGVMLEISERDGLIDRLGNKKS